MQPRKVIRRKPPARIRVVVRKCPECGHRTLKGMVMCPGCGAGLVLVK